MKLLEQIKLDSTTAFKAGEKEKRLVLSTLLGEIQRVDPEVVEGVKTWTDEQILKVIKKLVDANRFSHIASVKNGNEDKSKLFENEIISVYLPKMKSNEEMSTIVETFIKENNLSGMKDMGKVMTYLSTNYTGLYDGKQISVIVKSNLS